jgi:hypothetical protein
MDHQKNLPYIKHNSAGPSFLTLKPAFELISDTQF